METQTTTRQEVGGGQQGQAPGLQGALTENLKIDPVTALQDSIDLLSLSLFESLRQLRDAIDPSGATPQNDANNNTANASGGNTNGTSSVGDGDSEDEDDENAGDSSSQNSGISKKMKSNSSSPQQPRTTKRARLIKQRDTALVQRLAQEVLHKANAIAHPDPPIPGMHRTKTQQMKLIEILLKQNLELESKLEQAQTEALETRDAVRQELRQKSCALLGIDSEDM
jgi:hypothetical protein